MAWPFGSMSNSDSYTGVDSCRSVNVPVRIGSTIAGSCARPTEIVPPVFGCAVAAAASARPATAAARRARPKRGRSGCLMAFVLILVMVSSPLVMVLVLVTVVAGRPGGVSSVIQAACGRSASAPRGSGW